ncbi:MAG TPA: TIM-barrel domain-containing protein [Solirubrobacteraceae bacterium]|nr:TIM-barrel domain-containing protein [Solirubrobacteraceae bacterium]
MSATPAGEELLVLEYELLRVEVEPRPFALTLRRNGRRLLRHGGAWAAAGTVHDQFIHLTEGVIAREELGVPEQAAAASLVEAGPERLVLALAFEGGREGLLSIEFQGPEHVLLELVPDGEALRAALEWDTRDGECFAGLGVRHHPRLNHAGREVQLGADRRYTGPDCPPDMLANGGIPQGDCAPVPWVSSSRGYSLWLQGAGNGIRFAFGGDRTSASARTASGPLRLHVLCDPTPAARLRRYCRLTGLPALLPEWGYGFWKSRDVYGHQRDVEEDFRGLRGMQIPLDAIVIDSPWATQYNTWEFNPHQFPDAPGMIAEMRAAGVRTVVWVTPWVNLDSRDGQIPPQPESERLHREPASNYEDGAQGGHYVKTPDGSPFVTRWWMGDGSPVDLLDPAADDWWRAQARRVLELGVQGIKADDGEGYYLPDEVRFADGRTGAEAAWELGGAYRRSMQRALEEVHPGDGVLFGRSGWSGQQATGMLWGGDQASDFFSLRVLVVAALSGACSGISNWSHDVGGYLGHKLVERCPAELMVRWLQVGCFTPLMHAHGRMPQEPWHYPDDVQDLYRGYVLLHEQLVPYVRAAAATAARCGLPIVRPLCLTDPRDPRGWTATDAFGYGSALWVAPVLEEGLREREVPLPRGRWIATWSGEEQPGPTDLLVPTPLHRIPVWVRAGSIVVTYPAEHVAAGLGDTPEAQRPLQATLWGEPRDGRAQVRLADGTTIRWARGRWSVDGDREIAFRER